MFSMSRSTLTNVAFVIADPFYKKIWAGVTPLMYNVSYQNCCLKKKREKKLL
jgi:hypothetical protein